MKKKQKELGEKIGQLKNSDAKSATLESLGIPNLTNYLNEKEKNITTKVQILVYEVGESSEYREKYFGCGGRTSAR